jgi:hypothetical protein
MAGESRIGEPGGDFEAAAVGEELLGRTGADDAVVARLQALDELIGEEAGIGGDADGEWVAGIRT